MAYNKQNKVVFFPHSVQRGKTMKILRDIFLNDGYAVFYMLFEELGNTNNHYLDLSRKKDLLYYVSEFRVASDRLESIIDTLVEFDEIDPFLWENYKVVYSQSFVDSVANVYKKRRRACPSYLEICTEIAKSRGENTNSDEFRTEINKSASKLTHSRVEYSIVEESRGEISTSTGSIKDIEILKKEYLSNKRVVESFCKNQKINKAQLEASLDIFVSGLTDSNQLLKASEDFGSHFLSWYRKRNDHERINPGARATEKIKNKNKAYD